MANPWPVKTCERCHSAAMLPAPLPPQKRKSRLCGGSSERMKGLEPTTVCIAIAAVRRKRDPKLRVEEARVVLWLETSPHRPHRLLRAFKHGAKVVRRELRSVAEGVQAAVVKDQPKLVLSEIPRRNHLEFSRGDLDRDVLVLHAARLDA